MHYYEAKPKSGRLTGRHKRELMKAGFGWTGLAWVAQAERPPRVWVCTVRAVKPKQHEVKIETEEDWHKFLKSIH